VKRRSGRRKKEAAEKKKKEDEENDERTGGGQAVGARRAVAPRRHGEDGWPFFLGSCPASSHRNEDGRECKEGRNETRHL
jgi:hypothetical protein